MNVINMSMKSSRTTKFLIVFHQMNLAVLVFNQGDDPIAYLNKAMAFLTAIASSRGSKDRVMLTEDLDGYDSYCDDVSNAKAILMAKLSSYGFDVLLEVPHFETYHNDMDNQKQQDLSPIEGTQLMVVLKVKVNCKQFVEEVRFDDSFETDMDVMVE
ncbi:hypothetical protein Tco_1212494 [Tanacetum coccineum]